MTQTTTATQTYTVLDIRKTFESFEADLRIIARRTNKWSMPYVDDIFHDILALAEEKHLSTVDIVLSAADGAVVKATKFRVNADGSAMSGDRAGGNDWQDLAGTSLSVVLSYSSSWRNLSDAAKVEFRRGKGFKIGWGPSGIDTTYAHLKKASGQLYASTGYELQKENYS
ncbi:MAG: hypothetical protein IPN44_07735 [Flavobacteriales bacterium]|nr:hypothetical protein [Flavobacteriales bacterium]